MTEQEFVRTCMLLAHLLGLLARAELAGNNKGTIKVLEGIIKVCRGAINEYLEENGLPRAFFIDQAVYFDNSDIPF